MPLSKERNETSDEKKEKLKSIENSVRVRVDCEERAFRIVNKLIEDFVDGDYLIQCGHFITAEHYKDIVEERAISRICGYPVCPNPLGNTPKKKYHVSLKTNKVYEISERKNFCSNKCLKASRHFAAQISDSPLWMRDKEQERPMTLLQPDQIKGMVGDEVIGTDPRSILKEELSELEELNKRTATSKLITKTSPSSSEKPFKPKSNKDQTESGDSNQSVSLDKGSKESEKSIAENALVGCEASNVENFTHAQARINVSTTITNTDVDRKHEQISIPHDHATAKVNCSEELLADRFQQLSTEDKSKEETVSTNTCTTYNIKKHTHSDNPNSSFSSNDSKLDQLKSLMSKRKNMLSKMADIQTVKEKASMKREADLTTQQSTQKESLLKNNTEDNSLGNTFSCQTTTKHPSSSEIPAFPNIFATSKPKSDFAQNERVAANSPLVKVCEILKTWMTRDTAFYLLTAGDDQTFTARFSDPKIQQGYGNLCRRLAKQENSIEAILGDDEVEDVEGHLMQPKRPSKPVPDYKALKEQTEALNLNVMEFITGKKQQAPEKDGNDSDKTSICLPTVDAYDQHQIRVKIVLERLDKSLPDLLVPLQLSVQDISSPIRELVHTCRLEKDNIVLKPGEWTLSALLILAMLSTRRPLLKSSFESYIATRHFSAVLSRLGHSLLDLNTFAQDIIDVSLSLR